MVRRGLIVLLLCVLPWTARAQDIPNTIEVLQDGTLVSQCAKLDIIGTLEASGLGDVCSLKLGALTPGSLLAAASGTGELAELLGGSLGEVLTSQGPTVPPTWETPELGGKVLVTCDGTADDVEIQAAINGLSSGGVVVLDGACVITTDVTLKSNVKVMSNTAATVTMTGSFTSAGFYLDHTSEIRNVGFEGFTITTDGSVPAISTSIPVVAVTVAEFYFHRMRITGTGGTLVYLWTRNETGGPIVGVSVTSSIFTGSGVGAILILSTGEAPAHLIQSNSFDFDSSGTIVSADGTTAVKNNIVSGEAVQSINSGDVVLGNIVTMGLTGQIGINSSRKTLSNDVTVGLDDQIGIQTGSGGIAQLNKVHGTSVTTDVTGINCRACRSIGNRIAISGGTQTLGHRMTSDSVVALNSSSVSGTNSTHFMSAGQQNVVHMNKLFGGDWGFRPPMFSWDDRGSATQTNGIRGVGNNHTFGVKACWVINTGWHLSGNTCNWLGQDGTGVWLGPPESEGATIIDGCTGHSQINGNNWHSANTGVAYIRVPTHGERCSTTLSSDPAHADYGVDCGVDGTNGVCGGNLSCTRAHCQGITINDNLFMAASPAFDMYLGLASKLDEAPTASSISFAGNSLVGNSDQPYVNFNASLTDSDVDDFFLGRFTATTTLTNPFTNWRPAFGWTDYASKQSCREIVITDSGGASPIPADKQYRIALSSEYGMQTLGVTCSCNEDQATACDTAPTFTVREANGGKILGTTSGCAEYPADSTVTTWSADWIAANKLIVLELAAGNEGSTETGATVFSCLRFQ